MERSVTILKREIGATELEQINGLIETVGERGRTYISKQLCQLWDWRLPNGQLRDIACRDLLRRLEQRGLIQLPPARHAFRKPGYFHGKQEFCALPLSTGVSLAILVCPKAAPHLQHRLILVINIFRHWQEYLLILFHNQISFLLYPFACNYLPFDNLA